MRRNDSHSIPLSTRDAQNFLEHLLAYYYALKDAKNRVDARTKELAATASELSDRMKDVHAFIVRCTGCFFPERIEPTVLLSEEQDQNGGAE